MQQILLWRIRWGLPVHHETPRVADLFSCFNQPIEDGCGWLVACCGPNHWYIERRPPLLSQCTELLVARTQSFSPNPAQIRSLCALLGRHVAFQPHQPAKPNANVWAVSGDCVPNTTQCLIQHSHPALCDLPHLPTLRTCDSCEGPGCETLPTRIPRKPYLVTCHGKPTRPNRLLTEDSA